MQKSSSKRKNRELAGDESDDIPAGISQEAKVSEECKIKKLTRENEELKQRTFVSFPKRILTDLRNGLHDMYTTLLDLHITSTEQIMVSLAIILAKEEEVIDIFGKENYMLLRTGAQDRILSTLNGCQQDASAELSVVQVYKTTLERIKKTVDYCTQKLEKQYEESLSRTPRKNDGKFISVAEFNLVLDSFMASFESRMQSSEREGNQQVLDLTIFATAIVERTSLLREFVKEITHPLLQELKWAKARVEKEYASYKKVDGGNGAAN